MTVSLAKGELRADDGRLARGRKSRARIRDSARALFAERGFDATTLRAIAERAGMGASSIYRHIRSKEELLVEQLADWQKQAWQAFRASEDRALPVQARLARFLEIEHELLARTPDLTTIALRATTHPGTRVARRMLALQEQTIGLLTGLLQSARVRGEVRADADLIAAARALAHAVSGARIAWANGLLDAESCSRQVASSTALLFRGIAADNRAEISGEDTAGEGGTSFVPPGKP